MKPPGKAESTDVTSPGDRDLGHALLAIARSAIAGELGLGTTGEARHEALRRPGATFVTLRHDGELRGCIGSIRPVRSLSEDVHENAIAAAFRDPRFPPLAAAEFDATSVEVSLLSAEERLVVADEVGLAVRLRPGIDGVLLEYGHHRATLLPQVWETISGPREFLATLKQKAGLPEDFWSPHVIVSRYQVIKWTERASLASEMKA